MNARSGPEEFPTPTAPKKKPNHLMIVALFVLGGLLIVNEVGQPWFNERAAVETVDRYLTNGSNRIDFSDDLDRQCFDDADLDPNEFHNGLWRQVREATGDVFGLPVDVGWASIDGQTAVVPVTLGEDIELTFDLVRRGYLEWRICDIAIETSN